MSHTFGHGTFCIIPKSVLIHFYTVFLVTWWFAFCPLRKLNLSFNLTGHIHGHLAGRSTYLYSGSIRPHPTIGSISGKTNPYWARDHILNKFYIMDRVNGHEISFDVSAKMGSFSTTINICIMPGLEFINWPNTLCRILFNISTVIWTSALDINWSLWSLMRSNHTNRSLIFED